MRFMFTRFVTKLIAFRRRIGDLVGYTGGESMEQITLTPEVARLEVKSYPPRELANSKSPRERETWHSLIDSPRI